MEIPPPVRYAERDGGAIAFAVFGDGPDDMVSIADPPSHLDLIWTDSGYVDVLLRLGEGMRTIYYDRRGLGLSDPLQEPPTLETNALDLESVMDEAGSERATLLGWGGSTHTAAYFAATRPERVDRLLLVSPWARDWGADHGIWPPGERERSLKLLYGAIDRWGEGAMLEFTSPRLDTPRNRRLFAMLERSSASRAAARATFEATLRNDMSAVLPTVQAPTLVLQHRDTQMPQALGEEVAEMIPDSSFVSIDYVGEPRGMGDYWVPIVDEIRAWRTGAPGGAGGSTVLTTLLFTDIVASTGHAARLGDVAWRGLLKRHDDALRDLIDEHGGRLVKNIGDGSLSAFDGPIRAICCAEQLHGAVAPLGIELRAGVHTGECERVGLDFAGMNVHVASRVEEEAAPGQVLATAAAKELCNGSGFSFEPRGAAELKGVPGSWELFAAATATTDAVPATDEERSLRPADRAVLATARRAPGLLRAAGRVFR